MASKDVIDWDQPLPSTPSDTSIESEERKNDMTYEETIQQENLRKLQNYVDMMAYLPVPSPNLKPNMETLAKPRKLTFLDTIQRFDYVTEPKLKRDRLKRIMRKYNAITVEQLEEIITTTKDKELRKEAILKRKKELYYEMLTKLERQCRTQYLNVLLKKFANFLAKLTITMRIPPTLVEPYARMQRGIFCNILLAIGMQPTSQAAIYYNTAEGSEYEMCHKLSHALLSLIIKALDSASIRKSDDIQPIHVDCEMDKYIKDRLMCAAEKKIQNATKRSKKTKAEDVTKLNTESLLNKCSFKLCK